MTTVWMLPGDLWLALDVFLMQGAVLTGLGGRD